MKTTQMLAIAALGSMSFVQVEEFLGGLIKGLIQKDDLPEIKACMKDEGVLQGEIQSAVGDFEQHDLAGLVGGIKMVGEIIEQADADLQDCEGMKDDIKTIEAFAQIFKNGPLLFETVYMNTLRHYKAIGADLVHMV